MTDQRQKNKTTERAKDRWTTERQINNQRTTERQTDRQRKDRWTTERQMDNKKTNRQTFRWTK